jgi:phosphatidate cytidylyltransferase
LSDTEEPEDRRTEGVRIIGAQEAAEAAARPDVVRRRSRREKRYGDRPDEPEPASDLPKITISTTESEGPDPDRFGAVPVVRPDDDAAPRWADEEAEVDPRAGFGHARIVDDAAAGAEDVPEEEPTSSFAAAWREEQVDPEPVDPPVGDPYEAPEPYVVSSDDDDAAADATGQWSMEDLSPQWSEDQPVEGTWTSAADDEDLVLGEDDGELGDDDSFVLPHWTEPATGQVPKVVIGDDAPDPEPLATYGSQPRWRDEGEREQVTGFDDLIDEGPSLGALGNDDELLDDEDDDFFADSFFEDDLDDDEAADPYDDELEPAEPATRRRRPGPRRTAARAETEPRSGGDRNLVTAVGVGVGLVAVGLLCFYFGAVTTTILATAVVTVAAWEYFTAVRTSGYNPATLLGMVSVIGLMVAAYTSGLAAYPVVLGLAAVTGLLWFLWVAPGEGAVQNLGITILGVMWIGVLGSFATLFLGLGRALEDGRSITSNPGIGVLIAAVVAAVSHDVGAYFVGRFFGRTPLSPASPNKTQEGLAGGVVTSLAVTVVVVGIVGIDPIGSDLAQTFVFALLCALVAPLGDLVESFVKRDLAIKDMGSILPGHGGVLDRFDALLFVLPVAYFVTLLFDIWTDLGA